MTALLLLTPAGHPGVFTACVITPLVDCASSVQRVAPPWRRPFRVEMRSSTFMRMSVDRMFYDGRHDLPLLAEGGKRISPSHTERSAACSIMLVNYQLSPLKVAQPRIHFEPIAGAPDDALPLTATLPHQCPGTLALTSGEGGGVQMNWQTSTRSSGCVTKFTL